MLKYLILIFFMVGCSSNLRKVEEKENYQLLKALNLYSNGEKSKALYIYQDILEKNSKNEIALREIGIINAQLGNINEGRIYLEKAYRENAKDEVVLKNLGLIYFIQRKYIKTLEILNKIPNDLKDEKDYSLIGYSLYKQRNYDDAIKNYSKILGEEIMSNTLFFSSYIDCLRNIKSIEQDDKFMINIDRNTEKNKKNTIILATFYEIDLKNYKKSEEILKQYLSKNNLDEDVLSKLYDLYVKVGEKEKSKMVFELISKRKLNEKLGGK